MAAVAKIDKIETLETIERHGVLERVVRLAHISGLSGVDWQVLREALAQEDIPQYGSRLVETGVGAEMILADRHVKMTDVDKAEIELVYENGFRVDTMEDNIDDPFFGSLGGEVRCSVQQKRSNLDYDGNQVTVSHTYPETDVNFPGETIEQGGEFDFYDPQRSFAIHGIKQTNTPWLIANYIVGSVNSVEFSGEPPRYWLCVACNWKPLALNGGYHRYMMRFEFQFDADTWDPTVTFTDGVTGKPPADLVPGTGYKVVEKLPGVDFEREIGAWIQGG